jgi:hypothetical protein
MIKKNPGYVILKNFEIELINYFEVICLVTSFQTFIVVTATCNIKSFMKTFIYVHGIVKCGLLCCLRKIENTDLST